MAVDVSCLMAVDISCPWQSMFPASWQSMFPASWRSTLPARAMAVVQRTCYFLEFFGAIQTALGESAGKGLALYWC